MLKSAIAVASLGLAMQAGAQVTLYSGEDFHGRQFFLDRPMSDFDRTDFNDRASSIVVQGGDWLVCEDAHFQGRCVTLRPGEYRSLDRMGLNDRISSARPVGGYRMSEYQANEPPPAYGNQPPPRYQYQEQQGERLYQAPVTSVRAVVGPPEQRCWVDREQVGGGGANIPGAIVGGIVGGVLGHQIGSGRGRDVATGIGAVGGAAVGANVGRGGGYTQDVQRCENVPSGSAPDYWDVTYEFRGVEHHAQLGSPPGRTITVNENGEPRG
jgi:uncharacterized protein YcfJ